MRQPVCFSTGYAPTRGICFVAVFVWRGGIAHRCGMLSGIAVCISTRYLVCMPCLPMFEGPSTGWQQVSKQACLAGSDRKHEPKQGKDVVIWEAGSKSVKSSGNIFHQSKITCLDWAPDSRRVATGGTRPSTLDPQPSALRRYEAPTAAACLPLSSGP